MSVIYNGKKFKAKKVKGLGFELYLRKEKIEDISHIVGLDQIPDLVSLYLDRNQISEIKGLSNLTNLRTLSLDDNYIMKIEGLENLINLRNLSLRNNQINKFEGLENLVNLRNLSLIDNQISEIDGLEKLTELENLELKGNNISEIKNLENLEKLKILRLDSNPIMNWIKEELGLMGLAQTAVTFCARNTGKEEFNLERVQKLIEIKKQEITEAAWRKKYVKITSILKEIHNEVKLDDATLFYKFFGEFLLKHPKIFDKEKLINEYQYFSRDVFTNKQVFLMETYIINNYCAVQGEEVLTSFSGKLRFSGKLTPFESHKMTYEGRIYLTNARISVLGTGFQGEEHFILGYPRFGYLFPLSKPQKKAFETYIEIRCFIGKKANRRLDMKIYPKLLENETQQESIERIEYLTSFLPVDFTEKKKKI